MRRLFLVVALVACAVGFAGPARAIEGEQRLLVLLVTWGPEPYPRSEAELALAETMTYIRSASFGRTWVVGEVTPWLRAWESEPPQCDVQAIMGAGDAAATRAGIDRSRFTMIAYAFPHTEVCPWGGAYFTPGIQLNGLMGRFVLAHELGHTYGTPEEGPAWVCDADGAARGAVLQVARAVRAWPSETAGRHAGVDEAAQRCEQVNYESPYSVMGHGLGDYSAYEKFTYGWLDGVARPAVDGTHAIGAIDRPSAGEQALHVVVAGDEYWFEYRSPQPRWDYHEATATPGLVVYGGPHGLDELASRFPSRNLLLRDPIGTGRPSVGEGETFRVPGVFEVTVRSMTADGADAAFRWLDRARPAAPRIVVPAVSTRGPSVVVRWRPSRDSNRGSGIAAYEIRLDGRLRRTLPAVRVLGRLLAATEAELVLGRVRPGPHRVSIVAVDRAGNRSAPATRRFLVRR